MIDSEKLISVLEQGIVLIEFKSLKSNKIYSREEILHDSFMPLSMKSQEGDKILCYDIEFQKMEDIQINTIQKYVPLEKLS